MFKLFLLIFITVPLIEIYLLIEIGSMIGALPTIGLIIFTAVLGVFLLRLQGLVTLLQARQQLEQGILPANTLLEGLILLIAGALLLTPGFFTDTLGFLCLIPDIRSYLANHLMRLLMERQKQGERNQTVILEGEFREEDHGKHIE